MNLFHNKSIKLEISLLAAITSNPAKILGINKGTLANRGMMQILCIIDINKPWTSKKRSELKSKSKNTPIENRKLQRSGC